MANRSRLPRQLWTVVDAMAAIVVGAAAWNQVQTFSSAFFDPHHRGYPKPTHAQVALVLTGVVVVGLAMALRRRGPSPPLRWSWRCGRPRWSSPAA
ncbi:hypothetical protein ACFQ9X_38520 [Catenulispora yoronensis]